MTPTAPSRARHTTRAAAAPADDPRLTAVGLLIEVSAALERVLAPQLAEHGLASSETEVLLRLLRSPERRLRMSDLAAQAGLSASGLTRLVDRLERRGLVARAACPTDGRVSYAELTPDGAAVLEAALPGHVELVERSFTGVLSPAELDALTAALRKVRDEVHPQAEAGAAP